jgi:serine/threonine protein phosphatase PrpC
VADAPLLAGTESGDAHVVKESPEGVLVAVIDGVGHGSEAAAASRIAAATVASSPQLDAVSLVRRCHEGLAGTRGVVMTLAFFRARDRTMTWVGVGNIEGVLVRADSSGRGRFDHVVLPGGVVGHRLPPLRAEVLKMGPRDTLILATDGIRPEFTEALASNGDPQSMADRILARYRKSTDDALVLVARYLGDAPP